VIPRDSDLKLKGVASSIYGASPFDIHCFGMKQRKVFDLGILNIPTKLIGPPKTLVTNEASQFFLNLLCIGRPKFRKVHNIV
jgi:hypothetical protein